MTSITDKNIIDRFANKMKEMQNKQQEAYAEIIDTTTELCRSHGQFVKSALDAGSKKCDNDEMLFDTLEAFKKDLQHKNALLKEKQHAITRMASDIDQKEIQKDATIQKIERLKEEHARRKELMESQFKANKDRLKNLQKARIVFQEHLGMEIRKIRGTAQHVNGEKLQFVFRNINPTDLNSAYVVTLGIKEDRVYQIVSSDPALECLPDLERRLQETNNLPAFLANNIWRQQETAWRTALLCYHHSDHHPRAMSTGPVHYVHHPLVHHQRPLALLLQALPTDGKEEKKLEKRRRKKKREEESSKEENKEESRKEKKRGREERKKEEKKVAERRRKNKTIKK
ncbi:kinetochore protein Spc25-like isoform X2 [Entelurus aequoreus]|uniref:kinetochore protein Spc25-like isoform X2 n=1 Tax=Entelurus aequoreus TaxID=161455 RepID=UPI002B1E00B1|nr:kinetochore protein Spc25-like isoform X2 [Entelurus aequoreus]